MQISPTRPVTTLRPRPAAPEPQWRGLFLEPQWRGLFLEPIYADGLSYETVAGGQIEERDTEDWRDAA